MRGYCDSCHRFTGDGAGELDRLDVAQLGDNTYSLYLCADCRPAFEKPGPHKTIAEIKKANHAAGGYFFTPDTMRGFNSRIDPKVYAGRFFITSEKMSDSWDRHTNTRHSYPREYKVRFITDAGDVHDLTPEWLPSLDAARAIAREIDANFQP